MDGEFVFAFIPIVAIVGGLAIAALKIHQVGKLRELEYRQRIAMIERGMAPPPEVDPGRFEQTMAFERWPATSDVRAERSRTAGVVLVGIGLALMVLIGFTAGEADVALGVGGAVALIGVTFLVNSYLCCQTGPPPRRAGMDGSAPPALPRDEPPPPSM